jgi:hypothetical protein
MNPWPIYVKRSENASKGDLFILNKISEDLCAFLSFLSEFTIIFVLIYQWAWTSAFIQCLWKFSSNLFKSFSLILELIQVKLLLFIICLGSAGIFYGVQLRNEAFRAFFNYTLIYIRLNCKKQNSVDFKVLIQCYFSVNLINALKGLLYIKL